MKKNLRAHASNAVILVAEDDEDDALILSRTCRKAGLHIRLHFVENGTQAIDYLDGYGKYGDREQFPKPDVLILDLKMPRSDGFDVLAWLRNSPDVPQIPVVILTDSSLPKDKVMAHQLGASRYYVKDADPYRTQKMWLDICREWLKDEPVVG